MNSLRERLARFDGSPRPVVRRDAIDRECAWAQRLGWTKSSELVDWHLVRSEFGPALDAVDRSSWHRLTGDHELPPLPWAILDTETTGLESGTGTLVIVTAVLRIEASGSRLIQRFLPDPAAEDSFLRGLCEDLAGLGALLSYNGKSFDLPRLRARLRLHKMGESQLDRPHLDLVHFCRRLAAGWLEDARLASVETHLLGLQRQGDLPGAEVPAIYRRWLQCGDADDLDRVFSHNRRDVEHLHLLLQHVAALLANPTESQLPESCGLAIGRLLEARQLWGEAEHCYASLLQRSGPKFLPRVGLHWARLARRRGDLALAMRLCESIAGERWEGVLARIELAKLYEHKLRDFDAAHAQTQTALRELSQLSVHAEDLALRLQLRLERLQRRRSVRAAESA